MRRPIARRSTPTRSASSRSPRLAGLITARSNTILVGNASTQEIVLSRQEAAQHPSVIGQVAALTGQTPAAVEKILADPKLRPLPAGADHDRRPDGDDPVPRGAPGRVPGRLGDDVDGADLPAGAAARTPPRTCSATSGRSRPPSWRAPEPGLHRLVGVRPGRLEQFYESSAHEARPAPRRWR